MILVLTFSFWPLCSSSSAHPPPNLVEQDHRNIKRRIRQMLGFKSFRRAQTLQAGIEQLHMIRKGQYQHSHSDGLSPAEQLYLLAA